MEISVRTLVIVAIALVALFVLAIATGGVLLLVLTDAPAEPGERVSDVDVAGEDYSPAGEAERELSIAYNSRAQKTIDPTPNSASYFESDAGQKYLVVRMAVENVGSSDVEIQQSLLEFESDGAVYEPRTFAGSNPLGGVTIEPGGEADGWIAFEIGEDVSTGVLRLGGDVDESTALSLEEDSTLPIDMPV